MTAATVPALAHGRIICLIGAPADVGGGVRGAGMGPDALRVAGLAHSLRLQGRQVVDAGNLQGPLYPELVPELADTQSSNADPIAVQLPSAGLTATGQPQPRHLAEVVAWNRAVFGAVSASLARGEFPLLLGGDHSLAVGSISAVAAHCRRQGRRLRVLWLDAHADVNTPASSPSGNLHGMPVSCLLGHGPAPLVGWSGEPAALAATDLALLGIRSVDAGERLAIASLGLRVFDMRHLDEHGMRQTMLEALLALEVDHPDTHLHLSFDIDVLDPQDAPGVDTPAAGGPTYREMQLCMEMVADSGRLASLDLVEVNPARDTHNRTAEVAADLARSLFGASTLLRPQGGACRPGLG